MLQRRYRHIPQLRREESGRRISAVLSDQGIETLILGYRTAIECCCRVVHFLAIILRVSI